MAKTEASNKEEKQERKRSSWKERSRQWFLTLGTVLALLATIIGFLSDSVGVLEFWQGNVAPPAEPTADPNGRVSFDPAASGMPSAIPTNTTAPTVTAAPAGTATPTTPPVVAAENERLLLVAQFSNFAMDANYNVAGRIQEALVAQVKAARLEDTRVAIWPEVISDEGTAFTVLKAAKAAMVIWGEYDSGRVQVRFTLEGGGAELEWQRFLGAPTELSTTINLDLPRETQALALMTLGRLYRNAGDMARARAAFAQALAQQPSDQDTVATLTFYLAVLNATTEPPLIDEAIEGYTTVIELRPQWFNARYNRGLAYLTRYWLTGEPQNLDDAIGDFTWTLDAKRNYVEAYINRAIAYYARDASGDLEAAIEDLTAAIRFNASAYRAYYNRGLAYIRLDQQELWVSDLNKALEIAPSFWASHYALCWGYALDQMSAEGLPHCDEAVKHDPTGSSRDGRGLSLAQMGRLDDAAADLELYLAWLDTQPAVWSELNNRAVYETIVESLRAGNNPITSDLLEQLR
jgi:tetratricopeptide (TPR) repeat protein